MRHGAPILVRTDTAGCNKTFLAHIRALRETSCDVSPLVPRSTGQSAKRS
jgi:hypothetical protein